MEPRPTPFGRSGVAVEGQIRNREPASSAPDLELSQLRVLVDELKRDANRRALELRSILRARFGESLVAAAERAAKKAYQRRPLRIEWIKATEALYVTRVGRTDYHYRRHPGGVWRVAAIGAGPGPAFENVDLGPARSIEQASRKIRAWRKSQRRGGAR